MAEKTLAIIDGKSVFYRGYYAMRNLSKSDGTPTSGVYGFATIAMELVKKLHPDVVVVAWDKAKTSTKKRKELYPDYKAGRVKPPDDFYTQIPLLQDLISALGWNFVECDDYEADDIIGTLSLQADEDLNSAGVCRWTTYIISSDLDMLQIVDENTRMYRLLKGFSELEELDVPAVEAKYGIKKRQFLDLKALKGDTSDNIPGVPGIGEKGAAGLLAKYEDLDDIYAHLDEITGSIKTKLEAGKDMAYLSRQLALIMTDAPVKLTDMKPLEIDSARILAKLKDLEFFSLIRKFKKDLGSEKVPSGKSELETVQSRNLSFSRSEKEPSGLERSSVAGAIADLPDDTLIADDIKEKMHRDPAFAEKILSGTPYWDLNQADFLLNPLKRINETAQMDLFGDMKTEEQQRQEAEDQIKALAETPGLERIYKEFDLPLIPVLFKMEKTGVLLDPNHFKTLKKEFQTEVERLEQKIYTVAGHTLNINSPIQLQEVLFEKLKLPTTGIKKTKRGYSTGAKELEKLKNEHPVVPLIMEYREASKLLNTYIVPLPTLADGDNRLHTTFTQNVTATGRLSSVNPNLQNIPVRSETGKKIREGMIAAPGKVLVAADYAQFELRLAAVLAGDRNLIKDFNSGVDIHTKTAAEVFKIPMDKVTKSQRRAAKVINFGVMYGMSIRGLTEATDMSFGAAKNFIEEYFEVRKPIKDYLNSILNQARLMGYVETYFGRRRPTPDVNSSNGIIRAAAERAAQNMPIQGTEADLMKRAMIHLDKALPEGADLILQIHDSLVVECDEAKKTEVADILKTTMENVAPELDIKLAVDVKIGKNLGEV